MTKASERLEKFANLIELKLKKYAQIMTDEFKPDIDLLELKAKANLDKAQNIANNAIPDSFSGSADVKVKILKNKSFAITSNVKEVALALKPAFDNQIKTMLAASGPVKQDLLWNWFSIKVTAE